MPPYRLKTLTFPISLGGDRADGAPLCQINGNSYFILRGHTIFSISAGNRLGSLGPDGSFFFPSHLAAAVAPAPPESMVSFSDKGEKTTASEGFVGFPDAVIQALIKTIDPEGTMDIPGLVDELDADYGGDLIGIAVKIRELRPHLSYPRVVQFGPGLTGSQDPQRNRGPRNQRVVLRLHRRRP